MQMVRWWTMALIASSVLSVQAALQNDVLDADGNYVMQIRPVNEAGWRSKGKLPPPLTSCIVSKEAWPDVCKLFEEMRGVMQRMRQRKLVYQAFLKSMDRSESDMSIAAVRTLIVYYDDPYYFDRYGHLFVDGRFILPVEVATIERLEAFYKTIYEANRLDCLGETVGGKIVNKIEERAQAKVQIFRGFEDDHYQEHDELIVKLVDDFNHNRGHWAGATPEQAKKIHKLTPDIVKSHMIEETGGMGHRSRDAWQIDPLQVNVPGDWNPYKQYLGLTEPTHRNEGTAEQNIIAAIQYLTRKGFGVSGQPARNRPSGVFDGWYAALKRYNGRNDETLDGRHYKEAYAERIDKRAREPDSFVPISIPTKKSHNR